MKSETTLCSMQFTPSITKLSFESCSRLQSDAFSAALAFGPANDGTSIAAASTKICSEQRNGIRCGSGGKLRILDHQGVKTMLHHILTATKQSLICLLYQHMI